MPTSAIGLPRISTGSKGATYWGLCIGTPPELAGMVRRRR